MDDAYSEFARAAYGDSGHPPYPRADGSHGDSNGEAMALTFAMASRDEALPRYESALPMVFRADQELGLPDGHGWILNCGKTTCTAGDNARCVRHELLMLIPDLLPRQLRHHEGRPRGPRDFKGEEGPWGTIGGGMFSAPGGF